MPSNIIGFDLGTILSGSGVAIAAIIASLSPVTASASPILATAEQLAAEEMMLRLLDDSEVKSLQKSLAVTLKGDPAYALPDGAARVDHAIAQWTACLILRELAGDPAKPALLWTTDNTPHSWFGRTVPGSGTVGDNPDAIYRNSFLNGGHRYEIKGKFQPGRRPAMFSIELTYGAPGRFVRLDRDVPDLGDQVGVIQDKNMDIAPDGSFTVTIGGDGSGPNHLRTPDEPITLIVREFSSDWEKEVPARLTLRQIDAAEAEPATYEDVRRRLLEDLPDFVKFWAGFKDKWFGTIQPNSIHGPVPRDGGWGFMAGARYRLAPDEAIVLTLDTHAAGYTGIQITDPWMTASSGKEFRTSINNSQTVPDADGHFTYVIGPSDPGVANWLNSSGLREGYIVIRLHSFDKRPDEEALLKQFRVMKIADIKAGKLPGVALLPAGERASQMAEHARLYAMRTRH